MKYQESSIIKLPTNWSVAKPVLERSMVGVGLSVSQSFDLKPADVLMEDCRCPFHNQDECDCEYIVLIVYCNGKPPITLAGHGHSMAVSFDLAGIPYYRIESKALEQQIRDAFVLACDILAEQTHAR